MLCELAIANAEKGLEQIDDSSGDVMPAIRQLAEMHGRACEQTNPDAVRLSERIFHFQMEGVCAGTHQGQRLVESVSVPADSGNLEPGRRSPGPSAGWKRIAIVRTCAS